MGAREAVLGCHDLLVRVLSFAPTPSDLGRYAVVSKSFRTASVLAGGLLAMRTLPVAAVMHAAGALELNRGGLGLRIARAFAIPPKLYPTPPLADYFIMMQVRDERKCGMVCFSSSGVLTDEFCTGSQQFTNTIELADDAESDSFWNDFCAECDDIERGERGVAPEFFLVGDDCLKLFMVLVRSSDGAVRQLVHGDGMIFDYMAEDTAPVDGMRRVSWWFNYDRVCVDEAESLTFNVDMTAKDRDGAPWKSININVGNYNGYICTAGRLEQALMESQPWMQ